MSEAVTASFLIEATEESEEKAADASTAREGCSATGTNNLAWLLALAALLLRRRRR
jgi:MYXO-CTERM domain-containing protein